MVLTKDGRIIVEDRALGIYPNVYALYLNMTSLAAVLVLNLKNQH